LVNEDEASAISQLVERGHEKGYVTVEDLLSIFPEAESNLDRLEEAYAALLEAGITYIDEDVDSEEIPEPDQGEDEFPEEAESPEASYLSEVDVDDSVGLYLKEVGHIPLLSADEEVNLSKRIERGRLAREELAKGPVSEMRRAQIRAAIEDGWRARDHLITANSRLVISVAKKYMGRNVPFLDLIQEGNIGLIRAAKKFDYRRGHKFSTYATWWIRQAITRAIADQGRTIRVPVHMGDQISRLLRTTHQITQKLGRDPTTEELAAALEIAPKKVENMLQVARRPISLEMPTDAEEDSFLGDFIEDQDTPAPAESVTETLLKEDLTAVLNSLPPREVRILQLRYGLVDGQTYTLEEVGKKMGVTRERVRQIEAQALGRLRHSSLRQRLIDYLYE
jgi:RNA polymerase primary sigma factor